MTISHHPVTPKDTARLDWLAEASDKDVSILPYRYAGQWHVEGTPYKSFRAAIDAAMALEGK